MGGLGRIISGLGHAWRGVLYVFEFERNARIHLIAALAAFCLGVYLRISDTQLAAIFFAIILVFFAEIINTAFEKTLDLIDINHNPQIKLIKDMAAGAVLVTAVAATTIGFVIFAPYLLRLLWRI